MTIKGWAWKRLATAAAIPAIAIGVLAGFGAAPAMAGTAHHPVFHQETIKGQVRGTSGIVPVWASGAFYDYGTVNLNGPAAGVTGIEFSRGTLYAYHNAGTSTNHVNPWTCAFLSTNTSQYWVVGGTGRYWHAQGWGTAYITFSGVLPRLHHGHGPCNTSAAPLPWTAHETFLAKGPVALAWH